MSALIRPQPRPGVLAIDAYVPGKSAAPGVAKVFKLSSNETPLGPSPRAIEAYRAAAEHLADYPDGSATALREAIGRAFGLDPARIVCGAGSDELLNLLAHAFIGPGDEAIHTTHGFLVYHIATLGAGGTSVVAPETNYTANVDAILKWGMDCPDAAYSGTALRGDATYRLRGRRGTARYLGFQVMAGIESTANAIADELDVGPDGSIELVLSARPHPGNWMPLTDRASSLVVRQFFYDWEAEEPATLEIECEGPPHGASGPEPLSPAGVARQLEAIGTFLEASVAFWLDVEEAGRAQGVNVFRRPAALTAMGAAAENVSVWGSWELAPDEALVIEVAPPEAVYWSVSLGNHWWETIDYAARQSSLNGHQAVIDDDGVFRAVVSHVDPGVANWLDTAGHGQGPMIFRWLRADGAPVPTTAVVALAEVGTALPPGTARVGPDARRSTIAARRAGVRTRFAR